MTTDRYQLLIFDEELMQNPIHDESSLEHLMTMCIQQSTHNQNKNPSYSKQTFTKDEDREILKHVFQHGPNFNKIVKYFPGKTMNMIKNRYYKKLRYLKQELDVDNPWVSICNNSKITKNH
ncbi:unnamed protein product (macronuclear) [Paramecium tetraurelia]|uniref:Uncharacterized protein n=1 Tax=Paramecium tetraurelia TaxID=5888 RepID=A0E6Q7_PARTE|nr:uncharacterized protein GSPATT00023702001 [Paramecium tetraurelia]CAK90974.1 unnamed protein product [Paramecium tetraurelia]|eukprot:XP_001458371.1 hypothetical protein (macronuclear) [Paramecium tetraurelia strain d4-2]